MACSHAPQLTCEVTSCGMELQAPSYASTEHNRLRGFNDTFKTMAIAEPDANPSASEPYNKAEIGIFFKEILFSYCIYGDVV